jgi:nucleoside-diphosphate-sugar epimerase
MRPTYAPPRAGDVKHSSADISLARKVLVFEPVMSFKDGLAGTVEWYRKR